MPSTPKEYIEKINQTEQAWRTLRPDKSFGGMTLAQFQAKVQPCLSARAEIAALDSQMISAHDRRDDADRAAFAASQLVVNGVKADPAEGDDGELYEAMGFVRKSERSSGLHRGNAAAGQKT